MTPKNESAFSRKAIPEPAAAITRPPSAGPIARATLNPAEFSAMPAAKFWCETISGVMACHAGSYQHRAKAHQQRKQQEQRWSYFARDGENAESCRGHNHPGLGKEQELAAVHHVGDGAGW